jgi:hypothetical protein
MHLFDAEAGASPFRKKHGFSYYSAVGLVIRDDPISSASDLGNLCNSTNPLADHLTRCNELQH